MVGVDSKSHPGILDESDNNNDGNNGEEQDGRHDTLDAADGRLTGRVELSLVGSVVLGCTEVGRRKHSNNGLRKSARSFNYAVHNKMHQNLAATV